MTGTTSSHRLCPAVVVAALVSMGCGTTHPATSPQPDHCQQGAKKAHGSHEEHQGEHAVHHHQHSRGPHHDFSDAERWAKRFEDPRRDAWQQPDRIVSALVDRPDLVILDIGAATGYFPVRFARAVPQGQVFGTDIEESMVRYLNERASREGLFNLRSLVAKPDDAGIADLPARPDIVFLCNTYHHVSDRVRYFGDVRRALGPKARLAIVDFRKDSTMGPPVRHKLTPAEVRAELEQAGWRLAQSHDGLPEQYFLVFEPAPAQ